ncbi:MAG: alpha/beta fold hydrolase [Tatlockia sp.]
MLSDSVSEIINSIHAQLCYQIFITPIPLPIEKEYRDFAKKACEFFNANRSSSIVIEKPRHHVIHHFKQPTNPHAKKILVLHGWMSRAAYMARLIRALHQQGYEVFALDFPAHGEAKGIQLPWTEAVKVLQQTLNHLGPFYGVIGHSFGGSMLLNLLTLASQFPQWCLHAEPERVVLMASPTRMRIPVSKLARRFKLNSKGFLFLRELFQHPSMKDLRHLDFRHYIKNANTPILCIHGENDATIPPSESIILCQKYPYASLALLPEVDHVSVLIDERVEKTICHFLG